MNARAERFGFGAGVAFVVLGGLVAALTGPLRFERGSWLAAYLVLVCGVSQCVMSTQRSLAEPLGSSLRGKWLLLVCWNAGNILVIAGTLSSFSVLGYTGSIFLLAALVIAGAGIRGARRRRAATAIRLLYIVLALSIPVGLVLAQMRGS